MDRQTRRRRSARRLRAPCRHTSRAKFNSYAWTDSTARNARLGSTQMASAPLMQPDRPEFTCPLRRHDRPPETTKGNIDIEVTRDWAPPGGPLREPRAAGPLRGNRIFRINPGRCPVQSTGSRWSPRRGGLDARTTRSQSNVRGTVAFAFATPNGRTIRSLQHDDNSRRTTKNRSCCSAVLAPEWRSLNRSTPSTARVRAASAPGSRTLLRGGNARLDKVFPRLDTIKHASTRGGAVASFQAHSGVGYTPVRMSSARPAATAG